MAATLTAVVDPNMISPSREDNGRIGEIVKITGASSAAGDTGTYTSQFVNNPQEVIASSIAASISGRTVTLTDLLGIGNNTVYVKLIGTG
jgi:hypothetical protein